MEVLELSANEFGYQIEIGDQKGKFIQYAEIKMPHDHTNDLQKKIENNTQITDNGKPRTSIGLTTVVATPKVIDGIEHIEIAFFYSISLNKYTDYLRSNNFM